MQDTARSLLTIAALDGMHAASKTDWTTLLTSDLPDKPDLGLLDRARKELLEFLAHASNYRSADEPISPPSTRYCGLRKRTPCNGYRVGRRASGGSDAAHDFGAVQEDGEAVAGSVRRANSGRHVCAD